MERRFDKRKWFVLLALTMLFCLILSLFLFIRSSAAERVQRQTSMTGASLTVSGKAIDVPYVMEVDGEEISLDQYRYYYLVEKARMSAADESYFQGADLKEKERQLKADTEHSLLKDIAISDLAHENGLKLSKSEKNQIDSDVESQIQSLGGKRQYLQALANVYMTDAIYRQQWKISYLYEKLYQYYYDKGELTPSTGSAVESTDPPAAYAGNGQKNQVCEERLSQIVDERIKNMKISYGPAYDLIGLDTLK